MKYLLQLQRIDPTSKQNYGGLYIDVEDISVIYFVPDKTREAPQRGYCHIVTKSSIDYTVANSTSEVLDQIAVYNERGFNS